jgi:hypothetical protein
MFAATSLSLKTVTRGLERLLGIGGILILKLIGAARFGLGGLWPF